MRSRDKVLVLVHINDSESMDFSVEQVKPFIGNGHALSLKDLSVHSDPPIQIPSLRWQYRLDRHLKPELQQALT